MPRSRNPVRAIEAQDKAIGAFVCRADNMRAADAGPLRGIAVGIKDIIDTADFPTEMGSKIYRGWRPRADAPVVMVLKQAGASIAGKTTTTGFASRDPTGTLNPRNHAHTPGGSSSGSAAAVAAGMIPLALGTQTGGSVIRPGVVLRRGRDQTFVPRTADGRRQMFFVDVGHRRAVRGRRRRSRARTFGDDRSARTAARCRDRAAAHRGGHAGFCRQT